MSRKDFFLRDKNSGASSPFSISISRQSDAPDAPSQDGVALMERLRAALEALPGVQGKLLTDGVSGTIWH